MDFAKRMQIAKRQDEESAILANKRDLFRRAEDKYRSFFSDVDKNEAMLFGEAPERKSESFKRIIEVFANNPDEYDKKRDEINAKYPQFNSQEFKDALNEMWKYQYEFYKELIKYLNSMDNDYKTLFSESYKKKTFDMAKNGLFLFYEQTPDMEEVLIDDTNKNIDFVCNYFAMDDFGPLLQMLSMIFSDEDPDDFLRTVKTRELKEAVVCLINDCYGSCTRTMLALIENEHTNASSINSDFFKERITKGKERSIEISKQLDEINISYLSECWKLMDDFYREITLNNNKKSKRFINRNEVVHGVYWDSILPDRNSCIELILFYLSFKRISYFMREVYDMKTNMSEEFAIFMARKVRDNA